jgi:hypothetical protein
MGAFWVNEKGSEVGSIDCKIRIGSVDRMFRFKTRGSDPDYLLSFFYSTI